MSNKSKKATSIIEPTESELHLYKKLIKDIDGELIDNFSKEYFDLVQKEKIKISFAKFVIDKMMRPIKVGDTIAYEDENKEEQFLLCLVRKDIEEKTYLIFAMVDKEEETIDTENIYLFHVVEIDEDGIEVIDVMESSEEAERILDIIEGSDDVEMVEKTIQKEEE